MSLHKNLLYSNLLVSFGAAACAWYSANRFNERTIPGSQWLGPEIVTGLLLPSIFLFFATFCLYHFHEWFLTKTAEQSPRGKWITSNRKGIRIGILFSGLCALLIFFFLNGNTQFMSIPLIVTSVIYTAPKIPVKPFIRLRPLVRYKTIYLSLVWTYATTLFPLESLSVAMLPYMLIRFITFYMVCFLFDYRDRFHDQEAGLHSFIHSLSNRKSELVLVLLVLLNISLIVLFQTLLPAEKIAHILPLILIVFFRKKFLTKKEDIYFYGLLDTLVFLGPFTSLFFLF